MKNENLPDKSIGDIIKEANSLSADQVEQILNYQRTHNVKFGEAAVALGFAKREDVLWALAQQFHYPYTNTNHAGSDELRMASAPFSEQSEAIRNLRTQLLTSTFSSAGSRKALAVVSPNVGDGKSYFSANLAVAFSQLGGRTLLVDCDMRTPRQNDIFDIESSAGLSGILSGRSQTNVIRPVDALPSLYVLPVGIVPPNPLELLQGPAFGALMSELLTKFDYVIADTPAASHGSDARVVAGVCGAALAVGRRGKTRLKDLEKLVKQLTKSLPGFAGVVINEH